MKPNMNKYRITLPNKMVVVIEAESLEQAQQRFNNNYPQINNYTITS